MVRKVVKQSYPLLQGVHSINGRQLLLGDAVTTSRFAIAAWRSCHQWTAYREGIELPLGCCVDDCRSGLDCTHIWR